MFRTDYILPKLFWGGDFQSAVTLLVTDTLKQKETRGTETNISAELEWRKTVFKKYKNLDAAIQYSYAVNNSKDPSSDYDKHSIGLELQIAY